MQYYLWITRMMMHLFSWNHFGTQHFDICVQSDVHWCKDHNKFVCPPWTLFTVRKVSADKLCPVGRLKQTLKSWNVSNVAPQNTRLSIYLKRETNSHVWTMALDSTQTRSKCHYTGFSPSNTCRDSVKFTNTIPTKVEFYLCRRSKNESLHNTISTYCSMNAFYYFMLCVYNYYIKIIFTITIIECINQIFKLQWKLLSFNIISS